jgi:AhpD family alkylhydroperoxidase
MQARWDLKKASPDGAKAMGTPNAFVHHCGLERTLLELVKLRASQINGCGHCLDMHWKELRATGESEQRLYLLNAWREAPMYSPRERAALDVDEVGYVNGLVEARESAARPESIYSGQETTPSEGDETGRGGAPKRDW